MQILSGNLVGYANITPQNVSGGRYSGGGSSFLSISGSGYCLKDFKIVNPGGEWGEDDIIQFIQAGSCKLDEEMSFYWDTETENWAYAFNAGGHSEYDPVGDDMLSRVIPAGVGFLCNFKTAGAQIVYAGEVNKGVNGEIVCTRSSGRYVYTVNPNPYEITLADVKITNPGGEWGEDDIIQFMQPNNCKLDEEKSFYWDTEIDGWGYAFNAGGHAEYDPVEDPSAIKIKAGEAFLFNAKTAEARVVVTAPKL